MKTNLPDLVIANGDTVSNTVGFTHLRHLNSLAIKGPGTLPETVTVEVALTRDPVAADFSPLQIGGSPLTIGADVVEQIDKVSFIAMRLVAGVVVAAERTFATSGDDLS